MNKEYKDYFTDQGELQSHTLWELQCVLRDKTKRTSAQEVLLQSLRLASDEWRYARHRKDNIRQNREKINRLTQENQELSKLVIEQDNKLKELESKIQEAQVTAGLFIQSVKEKVPFMFKEGK